MECKKIKGIEIISMGSYYDLIYTDQTRALLQVREDRLLIAKGNQTAVVEYKADKRQLSTDNLKQVLISLGYPVV